MKDYKQIITIEPGKRGGKPCIRGMRITVTDILGWLASGMTIDEILSDFDELTQEDIYVALSYAADRENKIYQVAVWDYFSIKIFLTEYFNTCQIILLIQPQLGRKTDKRTW